MKSQNNRITSEPAQISRQMGTAYAELKAREPRRKYTYEDVTKTRFIKPKRSRFKFLVKFMDGRVIAFPCESKFKRQNGTIIDEQEELVRGFELCREILYDPWKECTIYMSRDKHPHIDSANYGTKVGKITPTNTYWDFTICFLQVNQNIYVDPAKIPANVIHRQFK